MLGLYFFYDNRNAVYREAGFLSVERSIAHISALRFSRKGAGWSAMKVERATVVQMVIDCLREIAPNDSSVKDGELSEETPLLGAKSGLDSIALVTLIAELEQQIEERFDCQLVLADDRAMSRLRSPFRRIGVLADYIVERMAEEDSGE